MQEIETERKRQFGGAESAGSWAGSFLPFILGGVGGLVQKGAATAAKKAIGKGLAKGSLAPSALALTGVEKAGTEAAKFVSKKGYGKIAQGAARLSASGTAFGAVEGVKAGIEAGRAVKDNKSFVGGKKVQTTMNAVIGSGLREGAETFAESAAFYTMGGAFLKGVGLGARTVKGIAKGAGEVVKATPTVLRKNFFNVADNKKAMQQLKDFVAPGNRKITDMEAMNKFVGFWRKRTQLIDKFSTKEQAITWLKNKESELGNKLTKVEIC